MRFENKLHQTLKVVLSENTSRKRTGNAPGNDSMFLKIALNLLRNEKLKKQGFPDKRFKPAWIEKYLLNTVNLKIIITFIVLFFR